MANKFKLWIEEATDSNTQPYATFSSDTQRTNGFEAGQPASAIRVNSALRQANLVACALMDAVAPDDNTIDFRSTRSDASDIVKNGIKSLSRKLIWSGTAEYSTQDPSATSISGHLTSSTLVDSILANNSLYSFDITFEQWTVGGGLSIDKVQRVARADNVAFLKVLASPVDSIISYASFSVMGTLDNINVTLEQSDDDELLVTFSKSDGTHFVQYSNELFKATITAVYELN